MTKQSPRQQAQSVGCLVLLIAIGAIWFLNRGASSSTTPTPAPAGWTKTAGQTSCTEWTTEMTIDERHGLADAILETLWTKDGAGGHPGDARATELANAIGTVCQSYPDEKISTVGAGLYELTTDLKP